MSAEKKVKQPITKGVAKVPVVMQMEALECGAASLAMILAYYGKWIPLEQVRFDCGVSRDGSSAKNVLKAARSYGLTAKGYRYEPEDLKKTGRFPCIIHWNFNHFVVLDGFRGNKAVINDPAKGTYAVSMEAFDESFTGISLQFEPSENFEPGGKPASVLRYAKKRLKGTGTAIAFVVLTTLISSLIGIINPAFSRIFMDRLLTGENPDWVFPFLIGMILMGVVQLTVMWIQQVYSLKINGKLDMVGNATFMWKILRMPVEFFSQRMAGDIQVRKNTNASVAEGLVNTFAPLVLNSLMMIFYLVVMIRYSPVLTLMGVTSVFLNLLLSNIISKKRVNIARVQLKNAGKLAGAAVAGIEMIETIKATGAENGFFEKWAGYQAGANTGAVKFRKLNSVLGLLPGLISTLCNTAVLMTGVFFAMQGRFTVGMILAFQGCLNSCMAPALVAPARTIVAVTVAFSVISSLVQMGISRRQMELAGKENGMTYAMITGVQKIKLSGAEKRAFARWGDLYAKEAKLKYNPPVFIKINAVISTGISLAGTIVMYYAAIRSGVSVADYYAFNTAYGMVSGAFLSLAGITLTVARIRPTLEMVKPLFETVPEVSSGKQVITGISGGIELNHISFRYNENMPLVLDDLSLKIHPGQYVAIVGQTGCGKSTLMRLLLGFEKPMKGAVYYDGKNLDKIDLKSLRQKIGVVMQNGKLFQGDIYSNIVISAPWLTQKDAWEAAELAGIAEDIRKMPMGMNTMISEGSGGISGGQKQRLMIARAIAQKPRLLMLDEATSALDNLTQKKVSEALDGLKCTRIVIAHRLSTIKQCDRILVLDKGKIIEDGKYEELLEKNGFFAELVKRQRLDAL